jgi:dienelactone hydrolase
MKGDLSFVKEPNKELTRDAQEARGFLRGQLLGGGRERDRFAVGEILNDLQQELVEAVRRPDIAGSGQTGFCAGGEESPQFGDLGLV